MTPTNQTNPTSEDHRKSADTLHAERLELIENRSRLPAEIPAGHTAVLHAIPTEIDTTNYIGLSESLPDPPAFGFREGDPETSTPLDSGKAETGLRPWMDIQPNSYSYLSTEGWFEAVTTDFFPGIIKSNLDTELDVTLQGGLECLLSLGAQPPLYVYISFLDVEDYRFEPNAYAYGYAPQSLPERVDPPPAILSDYTDSTVVTDAIKTIMISIGDETSPTPSNQ